MTGLPLPIVQVIERVLRALKNEGCPAALVGGCAVTLRSGVATRPVRDVDIYCPDRERPISILSAEGYRQVDGNKFQCGNVIVDIMHPDLPRMTKTNRALLDRCLGRQSPVAAVASGSTVTVLMCPTTSALLLLKLYSAGRRTIWLTRRHDLGDAVTLATRVRPFRPMRRHV